jgi:hypothetical protein
MDTRNSPGAGPAACAILQALLDELVKSGKLAPDEVTSIFAAARSNVDRWGDPQPFPLAREVLDEMRRR